MFRKGSLEGRILQVFRPPNDKPNGKHLERGLESRVADLAPRIDDLSVMRRSKVNSVRNNPNTRANATMRGDTAEGAFAKPPPYLRKKGGRKSN